MKIHKATIDRDKDGVYLKLPYGEKQRFTDDREFMNSYYAHEAINQLCLQEQRIKNLEKENKNLKTEMELSRPLIEALEEDNIDLSYDKIDDIYDMAKEMAQGWEDDLRQQVADLQEENAKLQEQAGHIVFTDGYDDNGNPIHEQNFKTYKETCEELTKRLEQNQNKKAKEILGNMIISMCIFSSEFTMDRDEIIDWLKAQIDKLKEDDNGK